MSMVSGGEEGEEGRRGRVFFDGGDVMGWARGVGCGKEVEGTGREDWDRRFLRRGERCGRGCW